MQPCSNASVSQSYTDPALFSLARSHTGTALQLPESQTHIAALLQMHSYVQSSSATAALIHSSLTLYTFDY